MFWRLSTRSGPKGGSILPIGSRYELAMFALFEIIVLELLARMGKTFGEPVIATRTSSDPAG